MANNFRRYQPRRSSGSKPWVRFVVVAAVVVILVLIGRSVFSRPNGSADRNTNDASITLVNDNANGNTNGSQTESNGNSNANVALTEPELTTVPDGVCIEPLSKYGTDKVVVLTFEMSAANDNAKNLLTQLKKDQVPASFFSTGKFAENNPAFLKTFVTGGYSVYNRGYDSTDLTTLDATTIPVQLAKAAAAIEAATGMSPTPYLRPAFNSTNTIVVKAATDSGYCIILGTVDATDWQDGVTAQAAIDRVMAKIQPGAIIQLHAGYDITGATVTGLVKAIKAKGYSLVTLPTLINS